MTIERASDHRCGSSSACIIGRHWIPRRARNGMKGNMEPDKCDDLSWFDVSDLPDNTIPYIRQAIENYRRGEWFTSFGWS